MTLNFWAVAAAVVLVLSSGSRTGAADLSADKPQIQGANLRIEFDRDLHSRVVARFDGNDTTVGPFSASETIAAADKSWTDFPMTNQKRRRSWSRKPARSP